MAFDTRLRMSGVRPQSNLFSPASPRPALRKSRHFSAHCSWKCTAILFMLASAVLAAAVAYLTGTDLFITLIHISYSITAAYQSVFFCVW